MTTTIANTIDLCDVREQAETHRIDQDFLTRLFNNEQPHHDDIAELLDLGDLEFRHTVAECLHDSNDDDWIALLARPVRSRTLNALGQLRFIVQGALTELAEQPKRNQRSRTNLLNRKERIDRRIRQAKWLNSHEHAQRAAQQGTRPERVAQVHTFRMAVEELLDAIQAHRLGVVAAGLDPESHDRALWAVLDTVQVPHGAEILTGTEVLRRKVTRGRAEDAT